MGKVTNNSNKKQDIELYCTNCGSGQIKVEWWRDDIEDRWYIEVVCLNCGLVSKIKLDVVKEGLDIDEVLKNLCRRLEGCVGI